MGQPKQVSKHCGRAAHRIQRTLDVILAVVTLDTLINLGVLATGVVLVAIEFGWVSPAQHEPSRPEVVVVHQDGERVSTIHN